MPRNTHSNGSLVTLAVKLASAKGIGSHYLADAKEAAERGDKAEAEKLYAKAQIWLDRYDELAKRRARRIARAAQGGK